MDKFKKQAIQLGLCKEWQDKWDETGLVEKYINGITWCMKHEFPSLQDMKKYDEILLLNNVYNEKTVNIKCDKEMYVFNASNVNFEIGGYNVCRIYVGRGTKINATVKDHAVLYIDNYGGIIDIKSDAGSKCTIWDGDVVKSVPS